MTVQIKTDLWLVTLIIGGPGLKSALIESVKKGQVEVGKDKAVVNQFYKIIDFIVQYFTSDGTNETIDEDETIEDADESVQGISYYYTPHMI